jgi:hypothetical protein
MILRVLISYLHDYIITSHWQGAVGKALSPADSTLFVSIVCI